MLEWLREETEGKLQMLLSLRNQNGLTSLFKQVRVFKVGKSLKRQENGAESEKLRRSQNTTDSGAVVKIVRNGPLGGNMTQ